jgi:hypothetical protein
MRRRNFKLTSLEEDLSVLGLKGLVLEDEEVKETQEEESQEEENQEEDNKKDSEEASEEDLEEDDLEEDDLEEDEDLEEDQDAEGDPLEERKFTAIGKTRKKGPHKQGFRRVKKAGGGFYFKKVTSKMLKKEKKRRSKSSYKRKAAKSRKRLKARGFGENGFEPKIDSVESKISELNVLAGLQEQNSRFEQYMECLDNARILAARLIDEFEGREDYEESIDDLVLAGSLAETAMSNLDSMDSLTESVEQDLEEGIEKIADLIAESVEKWEEMNESEETDSDIPSIFQE